MNRKETTLFLSHILERTKLNVFGKHYAKEVSIDPWTSNAKRVDYMQFSPEEIMPCVRDGAGPDFTPPSRCLQCTVEWLKKRSDIP